MATYSSSTMVSYTSNGKDDGQLFAYKEEKKGDKTDRMFHKQKWNRDDERHEQGKKRVKTSIQVGKSGDGRKDQIGRAMQGLPSFLGTTMGG